MVGLFEEELTGKRQKKIWRVRKCFSEMLVTHTFVKTIYLFLLKLIKHKICVFYSVILYHWKIAKKKVE